MFCLPISYREDLRPGACPSSSPQFSCPFRLEAGAEPRCPGLRRRDQQCSLQRLQHPRLPDREGVWREGRAGLGAGRQLRRPLASAQLCGLLSCSWVPAPGALSLCSVRHLLQRQKGTRTGRQGRKRFLPSGSSPLHEGRGLCGRLSRWADFSCEEMVTRAGDGSQPPGTSSQFLSLPTA